MIGVENSVLTGRNIPNLTCANQRYSIPSQTDQKTLMIGLKNLSFIARLFIYIKEKFTRKHAQPFSQILYKIDFQALSQMSLGYQENFLVGINDKKIIHCLNSLKDYFIYFKKQFPLTFETKFAKQSANLNKKPIQN